METFFHPKSVAVIGASEGKLGGSVILNLQQRFNGPIYPINPNCSKVYGLPCSPTLEGIPQKVDLVIVLVPAGLVPSVLEACARKGVKHVIIESAGFAEVGEEGIALQDYCKSIAQKAGIRVWGPNCMGLVDVHANHYFTFMHRAIHKDGIMPGRISLIVQSGMLSAIFLTELKRRGIGIAKACSIGNRMDVDECDLIEYLMEDPETHVIALYLESIPRGRLFADLARRSTKPIVLLKGGRSEAGARAALSHTFSLSGNSRLLDSVMKQCGVVLADDIYEMMDISHALTRLPKLPEICRAAVITLSGGAGILACDALERRGLQVAQLSEKTKTSLQKIFPEWMPVSNPIDLFPTFGMHGRTKTFGHTISSVLSDPNVDVLLIHYVAGLDSGFDDMAGLKKKADAANKAVFFWLMGVKEGITTFAREARDHGIAVHADISRIADCLAAAISYGYGDGGGSSQTFNTTQTSGDHPQQLKALKFDHSILDEYESKSLLREWDIPVVEERLIRSVSEAEDAGQDFGFPVVIKGLVRGETHKTESGLVHLDIANQDDLKEVFQRVEQKVRDNGRILIQKQIKVDYELIVGFLHDNEFGPCVMFGLGGIFAELKPDVAFALAPLSRSNALVLIDSIHGKRLLEGFRGIAPLNKEEMVEILVNIGQFGCAYSQIEQIDINPILVNNGTPLAVDASIILRA